MISWAMIILIKKEAMEAAVEDAWAKQSSQMLSNTQFYFHGNTGYLYYSVFSRKWPLWSYNDCHKDLDKILDYWMS